MSKKCCKLKSLTFHSLDYTHTENFIMSLLSLANSLSIKRKSDLKHKTILIWHAKDLYKCNKDHVTHKYSELKSYVKGRSQSQMKINKSIWRTYA